MSAPPFRLNASGLATLQAATSAGALGFDLELCCDSSGHTLTEHTPQTRTKLHQLDPHLHCSVIGTCLHPNDLRKLMLRHGATEQMSDLDVHHLAVQAKPFKKRWIKNTPVHSSSSRPRKMSAHLKQPGVQRGVMATSLGAIGRF